MCPGEETNEGLNPEQVATEEPPKADAAPAAGPDRDAAEAADKGSVKKAEFQDVAASAERGEKPGLDLLMNVTLPVSVELGRVTMTIEEVLGIYEGSVIELERVAGEPVDILVSGKLLGKGEVVVVDDKFGVRITDLINRVEGIEE
jgi:flagellar motor switch protein FliN/FliY